MGLFLVHQALLAVGGSLFVESEEGRGTRMTCMLPVPEGASANRGQESGVRSQESGQGATHSELVRGGLPT